MYLTNEYFEVFDVFHDEDDNYETHVPMYYYDSTLCPASGWVDLRIETSNDHINDRIRVTTCATLNIPRP